MDYPLTLSLPSLLRDPEVIGKFKELAADAYPGEFAALITKDGRVVELENGSDAKRSSDEFHLDPVVWAVNEKNVLAVVHSHPDGPIHPSAADISFANRTGVIMGIVSAGSDWVSDALWWGPGVAVPDLIGRPFRHGPSGTDGAGDCFALIKDFYEVHRNAKMPEFPRDWEWWVGSKENLYVEGFPKAGFRSIPLEEVAPGDVFLACVRSEVPNHGGILWDENSILHHLVDRLSARTALGPWERYITHWLRYEGDLPAWRPQG